MNTDKTLKGLGFATIFAALLFFAAGATANGMNGDHDPVESPNLGPGETWSHTFEMMTEFHYHCMNHPDHMEAMVTVEAADEDHEPEEHEIAILEGDDMDNWGFDPPMLTIQAGDTVTWTNAGSVTHRVMEDHDDHDMDNGHNGMDGDHGSNGMDMNDGEGAMDMGTDEDDPAPYIPGPAVALVLVALFGWILVRRSG